MLGEDCSARSIRSQSFEQGTTAFVLQLAVDGSRFRFSSHDEA